MRKLLDTKAGATFYEEMPNLTLCTRKDCIEFIFKPHFSSMEEANRQRKTLQQQQYVSKSLKRAFAELEEARTTNMELPDASDLFKLIDKQ